MVSTEQQHLPWKLANPSVSPRKLFTYLTPYTMIGRRSIWANANIWVCSSEAPTMFKKKILQMRQFRATHFIWQDSYWGFCVNFFLFFFLLDQRALCYRVSMADCDGHQDVTQVDERQVKGSMFSELDEKIRLIKLGRHKLELLSFWQ